MSLIVNEPNTQQDANNIRRAYKIAQNAVHKLKQPNTEGLWSINQKRYRQNLRDNVRRVLLAAPQEYGEMKLEITAWQYAVHNVISRIKKEHRGNKTNYTEHNIRMFLESTHGWYSSFMFQLLDKLAKYGGAENIAFDWWKPKDEKTELIDQTDQQNDEDKSRIQQILLTLCCKTLLCLGDICRYQNDLFPEVYSISLSYRYYMQAWHLDSTSGMPWNNIGSLMINNFHGVFSLFFYRRCLQSDNPYVDCYKNLKHLFDKSKRSYICYPRNQMDNIPITASQSERKQAVYWFCCVFLHLNGLLRPATYCTERELNTCCRRILDLLDLCLYFNEEDDAIIETDEEHKPGFIKRSGLRIEGPNGLTNAFLVTIFAALIQSFDDLRKQNSNRLVAANTLFVAAADLVVNHTLMRIKEFADEPVEDEDQEVSLIGESDNEGDIGMDENKENVPEINGKERESPTYRKSLFGSARRRRRDDDLSEGESEDEEIENQSEDEEIIYESDEESVYSQEIDSDEEQTDRQMISKRNLNNNTNHPILEEDHENKQTANDTRKLACTFINKQKENIDEEAEQSDDSSDKAQKDIENDDEDENDDGDEEADQVDEDFDDEMIFEFENETEIKKEETGSGEETGSESEVKICLEDVVANFENFYFLESIKVICDWLQVNGDIIRANLKSPLWARLAHFCNILPISELIAIKGEENVSPDLLKVIKQDSWMQSFSLWEDRFLYGIPIMSEVHDHIDFGNASVKMSRWDENLFRLIHINKFMKHVTQNFDETEIEYENGIFLSPNIASVEDDEFNIRGTFKNENEEEKSNQQFVLLPTPEALAMNLENFKKFAENDVLSTIVTNITVEGLDQMKKISKEARDATRWLDLSFSRCAGNIQSMQQPEQKSLQRLRHIDIEAWILQHLINIGAKLQRSKKVVLLVNSVEGQMSPSVRKALASASANNLSIQTVEDFTRQTKLND